MPTTNKPAPVATGTDPGLYNPVTGPVGPLDTAPAPVPPGPGLGVTITPPDIPVVTAQTDTANIANTTASSFVPNTVTTNTVVKYLSVSDESVAVNGQVTNLNFVGTGVSVANNANAINSVTVTIGGGATYGNSNVVTLLAGFGSNTLSTTGNVTGGNLVTSAQVVASGVIQSGTGLSTGGYLSVDGDADLHKTTVTGNLSATGNITGSYVLGNGSQLTGLPATYSNSNVQAYLPTYSGNIGALTVTGNLTVTGTTSTVNTEVVNVSESVVGNIDAGNVRTAGQVSSAGNITGNFFIGNGSTLSSVTAANVVGTVANATYATSAGSATTATTAGTANAVAGANVSGTVANATYALTSNAATYSTQATYADTANAVAGANVSGTVANATSAGSAATAGTVTTAAQGNITSVGILTSLSVSGNIIAANLGNIAAVNLTGNADTVLYGNGTFALPAASSSYGNANVTTLLGNLGSNVISSTGNISTTANISGGYILGNGSQLTSLPAPTVAQDITSVGAMSIMTYDGNLKYASYATVEPSSGNIAGNNISATGNITANNLGNISTINLTGSSSNVLYGNGTFAPAAGGGANTGNVTFDDVNVIGTGNLNLQPDPADAAAYVNIYLTGAADIHMAAGAAGANLILGTDEEANIAVLQGGNVAIQAGNVGGTKTWNFDTAGNLTLPLNSVVYETNIPDGALSGSAIALKPAGGTTVNQQLLIYPTANDGDHIHMTSGNLYTTELFLGSDNFYVKLANTGNVVINSNDGNSSNAMWTFDTDGNLTLPNSATIIAPNVNDLTLRVTGQYNICTLLTGGSGYGGGGSSSAISGGTGTGMIVGYGYGLSGQVVNVGVTDPGTGYSEGDVLTMTAGNGGATFVITKYNTAANAGNNNTAPTDWTFGVDGNITLPNNYSSINYANGSPYGGSYGNAEVVANLAALGTNPVSTTGNITAGYLFGNGSQITGLPATYGNANVSTFLAAYGSNTVSTTGNITSGNILTGGIVSAIGNITTANSFVGNLVGTTVSITGNVSVGGNLTVTGGVRKSNRILATTATLTLADAGGFIQFNSGPYTVTLPDPTLAANAGIGYRFWQNTASNITLSTPAGAFFGPSGTTTSTVVLAQATTSYWDVWSDGFNWAIFGIKIA